MARKPKAPKTSASASVWEAYKRRLTAYKNAKEKKASDARKKITDKKKKKSLIASVRAYAKTIC